jgi:co-chaperonin GroES (HSP10)
MPALCEEAVEVERVVPLPGYVAVKVIERGERVTRGIVLPGNVRDQSTLRAEVLDYQGPGPDEPDLRKVFGLKPGHICAISQYAGNVVEINDGEEVKICRQSEILCLVGSE